MTENEAPKKKARMGRPSAWPEELGKGVSMGYRLPIPVLDFIKQTVVKRLLSWLIMDEAFRKKIFDLIPPGLPSCGKKQKSEEP